MILFLAFMVGFFSGYNEYTRNVALGVGTLALCGAVIGGIVLFIGSCFMVVFSEVKPVVQNVMAITAVSGVFLGIPLAYYGHRKEKLWKLQKDWEFEKRECERRERGLEFWKDKIYAAKTLVSLRFKGCCEYLTFGLI